MGKKVSNPPPPNIIMKPSPPEWPEGPERVVEADVKPTNPPKEQSGESKIKYVSDMPSKSMYCPHCGYGLKYWITVECKS